MLELNSPPLVEESYGGVSRYEQRDDIEQKILCRKNSQYPKWLSEWVMISLQQHGYVTHKDL